MTKWSSEFTVPPDDKDGICGVRIEDEGKAMIMYCSLENEPSRTGGDGCFFVRLHSWDDRNKHPLFREFMGKKVKVTIETID